MAELKNLNVDNLLRDAHKLTLSENNSYQKAYPQFIKYFNSLDTITKHELVIGSHFVYAWMPRIIRIDLNNEEEVLEILNKVKSISNHPISVEELQVLKPVSYTHLTLPTIYSV